MIFLNYFRSIQIFLSWSDIFSQLLEADSSPFLIPKWYSKSTQIFGSSLFLEPEVLHLIIEDAVDQLPVRRIDQMDRLIDPTLFDLIQDLLPFTDPQRDKVIPFPDLRPYELEGDHASALLELARRTVPRLVNQAYKDLSVQQILNHVCRHYKVKSSEIVGKSRKKEITAVRQLAIFLIKKYTPLSYTQIGRELGKRDHTTILHSFNKIEKQVCLDKVFRREVEELEASLKAPQRS